MTQFTLASEGAVSQFQHEIRSRVAETQDNLTRAHETGDEYLVGIRLGELEGLARVAAEHGVEIDGVEESLARYGLATPATGIPLTVDLHEVRIATARRHACDAGQAGDAVRTQN
jgi:hypothetical protein